MKVKEDKKTRKGRSRDGGKASEAKEISKANEK